MKTIGYTELKSFSTKADGPFGFLDMIRSRKAVAYWSEEDFQWIIFHHGCTAVSRA